MYVTSGSFLMEGLKMKQLILQSYIVIVLMMLSMSIAKGQATYPSVWTDLVNVTINANNSLTKSVTTTGYVSGAASENILDAGADGYIQFTYSSGTSQYFIGFTGLNNSNDVYYNLYSFLVSSTGGCAVYQRQVSKLSLGALANGDILKIAREGTNIKFYRNNTLVYTIAAGAAVMNLRADVSIYQGTAPAVTCSFDRKLIAKPTFQYPDYTNTNGAIALQVEGGTAPFTYQWSSGEQTASISGKPRGTYTVTVTDAAGKTFTATYNLGYTMGWKNLEGVTVNANNSIVRTTGTGWNAGASSTNLLADNTDGWAEMVVTDPSATYMLGFSNFDANAGYNYIRFAFYITEVGSIDIYETNVAKGTVGSIVKGDVLRLSREANNIVYYKNGVPLRTVAITDKPMYLVDAAVYNTLGPLPAVTASFESQVHFKPVVTVPNGAGNSNGAISMTVEGGYSPTTIQWSSGEQTNSISSKSRGTYTATVTDALGRQQSRSYTLGYPIYWNDLRNVVVTAAGLTKNASTASFFDASAISANRLVGNEDGYIETVINRTSGGTNYYFLGLTRFNTSAGYTDIDYAFYLHPEGYLYIVENNVYRIRISFREGMVLKIAREGSNIKYYTDGVEVRSVATTPSYVLHADCSIAWGTIPPVTASFSYTPQTFYAIADGNWNSTATWSLSPGGSVGFRFPGYGDIVHVNSRKVSVSTAVSCQQLNIVAGAAATAVTLSGSVASLTVEDVKIKGNGNIDPQQVLQIKERASLKVKQADL
jgi:hypothetical protein